MTSPIITVKRCTKCGETKSADGFNRNRSKHDGLSSWCKECKRAYDDDHREEQRDYRRAYRKSHREDINARKRAYNETHREERRAYDRAYNRDRKALLGDPTMDRWQEITAKHATRSGEPWSEAEDAYLAASADRTGDDALALSRTYESVNQRISRLRKRGIELARDTHRR